MESRPTRFPLKNYPKNRNHERCIFFSSSMEYITLISPYLYGSIFSLSLPALARARLKGSITGRKFLLLGKREGGKIFLFSFLLSRASFCRNLEDMGNFLSGK